ncbi:MAG: ABC transporter permease [Dehalococcoidia bacterium]|nr:ABC transporter permease [Dehalococcoidia bacterium]
MTTPSASTNTALTPGASAVPARRKTTLWQWAAPVLLIGFLIALWEVLVRVTATPRWLLPPPSAIGQELLNSRELLLRHTVVTLEEVALGFAAALAAGIGIAMAIAYWRTVSRAVYPLVIASQTIPIIAIAPLLLVWVGYDIRPKVIVVALISFFPIVVNMVDGLRAVEPDMVHMLRSLGASRRQVFQKVQIPGSLPYLFSGLKIAAAVSVIGAVIGEWVGASAGLGYLMVQAAPRFQTALVFASIVVLSLMGIALFLAVAALERVLLPWRHTPKQAHVLYEDSE